ncbi:MAG: CdaR family protein [Eubacteriales bacterium]
MKNKLLHNWELKLITLIFAFIFWRSVADVANPTITKTFRDIPVTMLNEEIVTDNGKVYQVVDSEYTVTVTIKADTNTLSQITTSDIIATADFEDIELSSLVPVKVQVVGYENVAAEITTNPTNIKVVIEDSTSTKYPIVPSAKGTIATGYALGNMVADPETITITGPGSIIETIVRVEAQVDISSITEDSILQGTLICYDQNNLAIDQTLLTLNLGTNEYVEVSVEVLESKTVPLILDTSGNPESGYQVASVKAEPSEITIVATEEELELVSYVSIPGSAIDISGQSGKVELVVDVSEYLPEDIQLYDVNNNMIAVTVQIDAQGTKSIEIPVQSIAVNNNPSDMYFEYVDISDLMLTFTGIEEIVSGLDTTDVRASIDLQSYTEEGEYTVPVTVETIDGCEAVEGVTVSIILYEY